MARRESIRSGALFHLPHAYILILKAVVGHPRAASTSPGGKRKKEDGKMPQRKLDSTWVHEEGAGRTTDMINSFCCTAEASHSHTAGIPPPQDTHCSQPVNLCIHCSHTGVW